MSVRNPSKIFSSKIVTEKLYKAIDQTVVSLIQFPESITILDFRLYMCRHIVLNSSKNENLFPGLFSLFFYEELNKAYFRILLLHVQLLLQILRIYVYKLVLKFSRQTQHYYSSKNNTQHLRIVFMLRSMKGVKKSILNIASGIVLYLINSIFVQTNGNKKKYQNLGSINSI